MIPKKNRLRTKADFSRPMSKGKIFHGRGLSLKMVKNNQELDRFGIIISTKVSKRAVHRNKVRRRLRSIIGRQLSCLGKGWDVVVLTRKEILTMGFKELEEATDRVLVKSGLLEKDEAVVD